MGRRKDPLPERGPVRRGKPLSRFRIPDPFRTPGRRRAAQIAALLIFAAAVLYAVFSPPRFPLGDEYIFSPADRDMHKSMIIEPGGRVLLGPSDIRLWGRYPYVYGLEKSAQGEQFFILDMKDHSLQVFPAREDGKEEENEDEFESFLEKNGFRMEYAISLHDLFQGPRELRMNLKQQLGKR